ncbi:MAG: precorrin-2 C(20)-methyltransferase [Chloroflexi bacterium]|nr:precorrin-2 C(20)-methyltransferase [Chloroflexota bacterium]
MSGAMRADWGKLTAVGLGPGDPELVTVKAARLLREAETLLVPVRRAGERSLALRIAASYLEGREPRVVEQPFPADETQIDHQWEANAAAAAAVLSAGRDALFISEGDPLLYGSFGHLVERLRARQPTLEVQIVPGVSSVTAAAALLGGRFVERRERLAVQPRRASLAAASRALEENDTVVFLKVGRRLAALTRLLDEHGLLANAALVERCGWPEQRVVRDLRAVAPERADYFSLVVVRR